MGFPTTIGAGRSDPKQELEQLWTFRCELTKDRAVRCLAWNTANEDLLAVSYARAEPFNPSELGDSPSPTIVPIKSGQTCQPSGGKHDGLVLFWSLTNPEYPERIYHLPVGVTSIDFSTAHPYLLAAGFADGVVAIYDTRKDDYTASPVPIATSSGMSGKHLAAVWQVRWVARGGGESVVSVSSDGRVVEWSLKKGLSYSDLMTLKRSPNPLLGGTGTNGAGVGDGVISRQASGRCLAFASRGDPSVYFVGTEDGLIHKCSVSYNEQYLQTYIGHTGPVYQLLVSPFSTDLFLSCSGDWSLKLWHQADPRGDSTLTFHSVDLAQAVLGASWSPSDAAVFAAVAEDGRIELWDLAQSTLDPIVLEVPLECTTVAFAPKAPVLVVGDSTGDVTVYRVPAQVQTSDAPASSIEEQTAKLLRAIQSNKHD
eukprot:jgi/Phyca11/541427/estExt2_Genewise1Plus.C_PHYCAscaffold_60767